MAGKKRTSGIQSIKKLQRLGFTQKEIRQKTGIPERTLRRIIKNPDKKLSELNKRKIESLNYEKIKFKKTKKTVKNMQIGQFTYQKNITGKREFESQFFKVGKSVKGKKRTLTEKDLDKIFNDIQIKEKDSYRAVIKFRGWQAGTKNVQAENLGKLKQMILELKEQVSGELGESGKYESRSSFIEGIYISNFNRS